MQDEPGKWPSSTTSRAGIVPVADRSIGSMTDGQLLERFISRHDEGAFESVVLRHGPMVLRVCRDVLNEPNDADDAFQATFLVLVRNARSIRDRDSLGRWLYGVATRIALRAKVRARRRGALERQGIEMAVAPPDFEADRRELQPLLHAELNRLSEKFRAPLVLCYLEGHSQEEAARRLGCPVGTLKSRLTRGREILRSRLTRRGLAVTLALLIMLLSDEASAVPASLVRTTVDAGVLAAKGVAPDGLISESVAELMEEEAESIPTVPNRQLVAGIALAAVILANGVVLAQQTGIIRLLMPTARKNVVPPGGTCAIDSIAVARPGLPGTGAAVYSPKPSH